MDLLEEWFEDITISNKNVEKERVSMEPYIAIPTPVVDLIFITCDYFEQPEEVRYLSVELFDRFIRLHFKDLINRVWTKNRNDAEKQWKNIEQKLRVQTSLRMLSCIQIASKFIIQPKVLKPKDIKKFLESEQKIYTLSKIMASEVRVLKTLDFKLNFPTVLTNVGILLEQLWSSELAHLLPKDVYQRAILFTDVVYLHHHEIICKLLYLTTGRWDVTPEERKEIQKTECNILYQAAAVVVLSINFTSAKEHKSIYKELALLTNLPVDEIRALVEIVNQIVLS